MSEVHAIANKAEKEGVIVNPGACETCGKVSCRLVKHHRDYDKPLEVTWLCYSCHRSEHGSNKALSDPDSKGTTCKSLMTTARSHEIFRREALTISSENISKGKDGEVNMKKLLNNIAEGIQDCRKFADLPEKE